MSFFLEHTQRIIHQYDGSLPLAIFLKAYYKKYPRLGSRDRKALTEAVFIYYRCRRFFDGEMPVAEVIASGRILCESANAFLEKMTPAGRQTADPERLLTAVMPAFAPLLSTGIALDRWLRSLWQQPQLFIRLRKRLPESLALLKQHNIPFAADAIAGNMQQDVYRITNGAAIDRILPEESYVVQDRSSQASIYLLLQQLRDNIKSVWDVCSGAGGKSLLLKDKMPPFTLLATDIRESILHNLQMRFRKYGLGRVETMVLNSASEAEVTRKMGGRSFDLVLCDVPCSGSGTWARTPEQFHFFKEKDLLRFEALQFPIALHAQRYTKPGGTFAYITCSVFARENEAVANQLSALPGLHLLHQQLVDGIGHHADCMFIAIFRKEE